jgi:hypothetical protein
MYEPPFSLAFVMVKESFADPAILFYLASDANKNKREDNLNHTFCLSELGEVPLDNRSKRHSFRFCSSLKWCSCKLSYSGAVEVLP